MLDLFTGPKFPFVFWVIAELAFGSLGDYNLYYFLPSCLILTYIFICNNLHIIMFNILGAIIDCPWF
jgi:hypothetical protein